MKILNGFQNKVALWSEQVQAYLDRLSLRERVMVVVATIVVVVASVGASLWYMHKAAEYQNQRVNQLKDLVVWMQSNVVTMKPADDMALTTADKIQRAAQQQSLSVVTQQQGEKNLQISVQHENYAVLANFLGQIAQMGVSIEQLDMEKTPTQIKLTAIVY